MRFKHYLLTILFPIFMIFAFSPIASAANVKTDTEGSEIKIEKNFADGKDSENEFRSEDTTKIEITQKKEIIDNQKSETNIVTSKSKIKTTSKDLKQEEAAETSGSSENNKSENIQAKNINYTVEFTHKDLQYVLPGGTSVKLSKILGKLQLSGKVTEVECSNDNLFSATKENGDWVIKSHKPFYSEERLYVTIDNTRYNIKVTDDASDYMTGDATSGIRWQYVTSTQTLTITKVGSTTAIPNYRQANSPFHNGYSPISDGNVTITKVVIGEGITSIGEYAFYQLGGAQNKTPISSFSVELPSSLTSLGQGVFEEAGVNSINLYNTGVRTLPLACFLNCRNLTKIYIPDTVTHLNERAFEYCTSLMCVNIPNSCSGSAVIGSNCFNGTPNNMEIFVGASCGDLNTPCSGNVAACFPNHGNQYFHWYGWKCGNTMYAFPKSSSTPKGHSGNYNVPAGDSNRYILYFFGYGDMYDYTAGTAPWYSVRDNFRAVHYDEYMGQNEITGIGAYAFYNFTNNTSRFPEIIELPSSITSVGEGAFKNCTNLQYTYPIDFWGHSTFPSGVTEIGASVFEGCTSLRSFTIPSTTTSIGVNAFYGCSSLTSITIPNSVTTIGNAAFQNCTSLTGINIPKAVTTIGTNAFRTCKGLTSITFEDGRTSVLTIGSGAFRGTDGSDALVGTLTIPAKVAILGDAFSHSDNRFTTVDLSAMDQSIGDTAFWGDSGIQNVYLGSGITSIGGRAFTDATTIWYMYGTKAELIAKMGYNDGQTTASPPPPSGTTITQGGYSFPNNNHVFHFLKSGGKSTDMCGPALYWRVEYDYNDNADNTIRNTTMYVTGSGNFYPTYYTNTNRPWINNKNATGGTENGSDNAITKVVISGATNIEKPIFRKLTALTTVEFLDNNITEIKQDAFWSCTSLATLTVQGNSNTNPLPSSLTTIGPGAFQGCSFSSITIPSSVTTIQDSSSASQPGWGAFANCTSLTTVTFGQNSSLTYIGLGAFYNCSNLTSITIPNAVTTIGNNAFQNCTSLTGINIPKSVTTIGTNAFNSCKGLTSITFEDGRTSVLTINAGAFRGTDGNDALVGTLTIPAKVAIVGDAFSHSDNRFTTVDLSAMDQSIGHTAFWGDSGIQNVYLGSGITSIGGRAFTDATTIWYMYGTKAELIAKMGYNDGQTTASPPPPSGTTITQGGYSFPNGNHVFHFLKSGGRDSKCGANLYWRVEYEYNNLSDTTIREITMYVTGSGAFYPNYANDTRPWTNNYDGENTITKVVISGATNIEQPIFRKLTALTTVEFLDNNITEIKRDAFWACTSLTTLTVQGNSNTNPLPSSLTTIGPGAFQGCSFSSIIIPSSVTTIQDSSSASQPGWGAFANCTSLTTVTFEQNSSLTYIGLGAFYNCSSITDITIPTSITSAGMKQNAFVGLAPKANIRYAGTEAEFTPKCTTSVVNVFGYDIAGTATNNYIFHFKCGDYVWYSIDGSYNSGGILSKCDIYYKYDAPYGTMIKTYDWNNSTNRSPFYTHRDSITYIEVINGITYIGNSIFQDCTSVTEISLPGSLTSTGTDICNGCTALTGVYNSNTPLTVIQARSFKNCSNLNRITIPNNLTAIGDEAFYGCSALPATYMSTQIIYIPSTVTTIGTSAFQNCAKLNSVTIPTGMNSMGTNAFSGLGTDSSVTQVDINYAGKQSAFESKCTTSIANVFGYDVVNNGNYYFHFVQDIIYRDGTTRLTGLSPTSYTTASGSTVTLPATVGGQSRTFDCWCIDPELTIQATTPFTAAKASPYGDLTFYAKWQAVMQTITYTLNSHGSFPITPVTEYDPNSVAPIALSVPTDSNCAFLGWHFASDLSDDAICSFSASTYPSGVTVYAGWYEREDVPYWANEALTLPSTTPYEIIKNWETTLGTAGATTWYVLDGNTAFNDNIQILGDVHIILKDNCKLTSNESITINSPNSITFYAQESDNFYNNQDIGNILYVDNMISINSYLQYDGHDVYGQNDGSSLEKVLCDGEIYSRIPGLYRYALVSENNAPTDLYILEKLQAGGTYKQTIVAKSTGEKYEKDPENPDYYLDAQGNPKYRYIDDGVTNPYYQDLEDTGRKYYKNNDNRYIPFARTINCSSNCIENELELWISDAYDSAEHEILRYNNKYYYEARIDKYMFLDEQGGQTDISGLYYNDVEKACLINEITGEKYDEDPEDAEYYLDAQGIPKYHYIDDGINDPYFVDLDDSSKKYYFGSYDEILHLFHATDGSELWLADDEIDSATYPVVTRAEDFDGKTKKYYLYDDNEGNPYFVDAEDPENKYYFGTVNIYTDDPGSYGNLKLCGSVFSQIGTYQSAAIGGEANHFNGDITIYGGYITAKGDGYSAAIGGGKFDVVTTTQNLSTITIHGGRIYAIENNWWGTSAAIGGGANANGGAIVINGGQITSSVNSGPTMGAGGGISGDDNNTTISLSWTNKTDYIANRGGDGINCNKANLAISNTNQFVFVGEERLDFGSEVTADDLIAADGFTIIPGLSSDYILQFPQRIVIPFKTTRHRLGAVSVRTVESDGEDGDDESVASDGKFVNPYKILLNISKTDFEKTDDSSKTMTYNLKNTIDTDLVNRNIYFTSSDPKYMLNREVLLDGSEEIWIKMSPNVWENLPPGIYNAVVTFNVGLSTKELSDHAGVD